MEKEIIFIADKFEKSVDGNEITIPRIGEEIDISGLFDSNEERKDYRSMFSNLFLYVVSIQHNFDTNKQIIEITLSENPSDELNQFYQSL